MLTSLKSLLGYRLHARDGYLGRVCDFHFDNRSWTIKNLAVNPHGRLPWRKVLIARDLLGPPDWVDQTIPVNQTCKEIRHDPGLDSDPPLYRQVEKTSQNFYGSVPHWTSFMGMPPLAWPLNMPGVTELRSLRFLTGYAVVAEDGQRVGHVHDFVAEDEDWRILMMIAELEGDLMGRTVAVNIDAVMDIQFEECAVRVSEPAARLRDAPSCTHLLLKDPGFKDRVQEYYGAQAHVSR